MKHYTDIDLSKALADIWDYLDDDQRRLIADNTLVQTYRKGDYIYRTDEDSLYMMCVLRGRVKLECYGVGGRTQIMRMLRPYQFFGYRSYFAGQGHVTEAVAMEATVIACVDMHVMERIVKDNGSLGLFFIRALAVDLGESDRRTVNLTQKHIRGRLAESIMSLIDKYGMEADGCTVNIYLSREDLASLSNMTTSNAIRTLSNFVNEGILLVDGRRIKVIDLDKLRHINACG